MPDITSTCKYCSTPVKLIAEDNGTWVHDNKDVACQHPFPQPGKAAKAK